MKNIVLIGYMGCGKSTIAKELQKKLNISIFDTDAIIVKEQRRSINDIFTQEGESAFRDMETNLLSRLCDSSSECIISTGGGMPVREENRTLLKKCGTVFFLKASTDTILEHVKNDTERPLLKDPDRRGKIDRMLSERTPIYEGVGDYIIETDGKTVEQVVEEILRYKGETI